MELHLHARRQPIGQHPFRELARSSTPWTGEKVDGGALRQAMADDVARVLVVGAVLDDELHLVVRPQPLEVAPVVARRLAAAGALDVEDRDHGSGHALGAAMAAGLEQHRRAAVEQRCISG